MRVELGTPAVERYLGIGDMVIIGSVRKPGRVSGGVGGVFNIVGLRYGNYGV